MSDDCSKFAIGNIVYVYSSAVSGYSPVNNNFQTFTWTSIDSTFTYVIVSSTIWKYNATSLRYVSYYSSLNATITSSCTLKTYANGLVIYQTSSSSAYVNAFTDNSTSLALFADTSLVSFLATPKVALSPQLSKLIVYGKTSGGISVNFYYFNFTGSSATSITFPT